MDEIIKRYAPIIVIAFIFSFLLLFLFPPSFIHPWGVDSEGDSMSFMTYVSSRSMSEFDEPAVYDDNADIQMLGVRAERANPTVWAKGRIVEETEFVLIDNFEFTDCDGLIYSHSTPPSWGGEQGGVVQVMAVYKGATDLGIECTSTVFGPAAGLSQGIAKFPDPGVYTVKFKVMDRYNVETINSCQLAIDMKVPPPAPLPVP